MKLPRSIALDSVLKFKRVMYLKTWAVKIVFILKERKISFKYAPNMIAVAHLLFRHSVQIYVIYLAFDFLVEESYWQQRELFEIEKHLSQVFYKEVILNKFVSLLKKDSSRVAFLWEFSFLRNLSEQLLCRIHPGDCSC